MHNDGFGDTMYRWLPHKILAAVRLRIWRDYVRRTFLLQRGCMLEDKQHNVETNGQEVRWGRGVLTHNKTRFVRRTPAKPQRQRTDEERAGGCRRMNQSTTRSIVPRSPSLTADWHNNGAPPSLWVSTQTDSPVPLTWRRIACRALIHIYLQVSSQPPLQSPEPPFEPPRVAAMATGSSSWNTLGSIDLLVSERRSIPFRIMRSSIRKYGIVKWATR